MKRYIDPAESSSKRMRRYIVGAIIVVAYILFCFWAGWGWLVLLPLIIDNYFTKFINWGWYRNSPYPIVRSVCKLMDDILFAVIGVTFLTTFFFQNFGIPSSSLEKTMLIGDYLWVNKLSYGPRMPMTPLAFPLVHNEIFGHKSYSETPTLGYHRLRGLGKVERNDLVVFNFPAGDTVALRMPNPDYYSLCKIYGREAIHNNPKEFGEVVYRPIDRRDHYVKRCIGMPGETIQIINNQVYINGKALVNPKYLQLNYLVQTNGTVIGKEILDALEINYRDVSEVPIASDNSATDSVITAQTGLKPIDDSHIYGRVYHIPLTQEMKQKLGSEPYVKAIIVEQLPQMEGDFVYPLDLNKGWNRDNYGPLMIPRAGLRVELTPDNLKTYARCIHAYEGHRLEVQADGTALINGQPATHYTFSQDYYFMMGDNRHNSADSRAWGFVPEDHIVGKPAFIWMSLNDEQSWFSGRIRWSRLFSIITGE